MSNIHSLGVLTQHILTMTGYMSGVCKIKFQKLHILGTEATF